jgi:uncharacterized membrane protein YkvA (DUF1232 family)
MPLRPTLAPQEHPRSWRDEAEKLLVDVRALYLASKDPRTPLRARLVAVFVGCYLVSPVQLIPNWVPVIGYLDDFVVSVLGLRLIRRWIPAALMEEYRQAAEEMSTSRSGPNAALALVVTGLFGLLAAAAIWGLFRCLRR